jgi:hypothetical protein
MKHGVVVTTRNQAAVLLAVALGRQRGLADSSDVLDQVIDQLHEAQAQHRALLAKIKDEFDREIAELQRQLAEARAELKLLRVLDEFSRWQPADTTLN